MVLSKWMMVGQVLHVCDTKSKSLNLIIPDSNQASDYYSCSFKSWKCDFYMDIPAEPLWILWMKPDIEV